MRMRSRVYVPSVTVIGLLVIGHCIGTLIQQPLELDWLTLAALTLLTGSFTIKLPGIPARLSVSETFVFASVLLFGTCAGTVTVALEILIVIVTRRRKHRDPVRILFNVSSAALSIWLASHTFYYFADIPPLASYEGELHTILLLPLAALATTYFLLNSGMVALAVALHRREPALTIWRTNFLGLAVNYFGGASLAALFVTYTRTIDIASLGIIVPLLIISYLTFKTSLGRVEDATRHVEEVNRLYFSTIETLATAIDAKDQVTHGHIRRVQKFALGLAHHLGVTDSKQLQALEAAALLHDTGKLVVPEHILNKPGKLTRGEFEKMKAHASVGADILSSIQFPYPVVPIVRHHHENWDGSGYPDGLRGTDIPIGARILAVVDCFDALTSDRPYRPRMTDTESISILLQRRGTMYDPLVVDKFAAIWEELAATVADPTNHGIATSKTEPLLLVERGDEPVAHSVLSEPLAQLLDAAIRQTGAVLAILFATDTERDRLLSVATRSPEGQSNFVVSMPLGSGVSGWVAVNATPMINADAALDFRDSTNARELARSLSVPILVRGSVIGVLSLYSNDRRGFSEDDRDLVQRLVAGLDSEAPSKAFELLLRATRATTGPNPTVH
jgi:putative nucleotidyltransferase with HDIG domain